MLGDVWYVLGEGHMNWELLPKAIESPATPVDPKVPLRPIKAVDLGLVSARDGDSPRDASESEVERESSPSLYPLGSPSLLLSTPACENRIRWDTDKLATRLLLDSFCGEGSSCCFWCGEVALLLVTVDLDVPAARVGEFF